MRLLLLCVVLLAGGAIVRAQDNQEIPEYNEDYALYDDDEPVDEPNENVDINPVANIDEPQNAQNTKEQVDPEQEKFADYQIEDNRSESAEKKAIESVETPAGTTPDSAQVNPVEELQVLPLEEPKDNEAPEKGDEDLKYLDLDDDFWSDIFKDDVEPLPLPDKEQQDIIDETKDILNKEGDYMDKPEQSPIDDKEINDIIEETNKLLAESDDAFDANDYDNSDEAGKSDEDIFSENNDEEDTPAKVYADLNEDLDKLFETLDKLSDDSADTNIASDEQPANEENVKDYEEKYEKPYNENMALLWRNAEVEAVEPEKSAESEPVADDGSNDEAAADNDGNDEAADDDVISTELKDDDYENVDDSNLSQIFADIAKVEEQINQNDEQELVDLEEVVKETKTTPAPENNEEVKDLVDYYDNYDDHNDGEPNADDDIDSVIKQIFANDVKEPQPYGNDALVDEDQRDDEAAEFESVEEKDAKIEKTIEQETTTPKELNSAELNEFITAHKEQLDVNSDSFAKHVAPIHVTLSVNEPTVITSPNYPNPYPVNNIVDWIFEGPGTGIELNITDFEVNGAMGDYLLIIPGGIDTSSKDGLVFTYKLNTERRYRFSDVSRMFVRFESMNGWPFLKGFSLSAKLMWPLPELEINEIEDPSAEAVLDPPQETLTLYLAGFPVSKFQEIKEVFTTLLADMAKAYIRDNDIEQGLNTTYEVTQITRTAMCNIQWPNHETCVEVTFGVPLQYEEETKPRLSTKELGDMWRTYVQKNEYAERLLSLGVTEFEVPDERSILMVWLVIGLGVLLSMAVLTLALRRFNCFEDYTRMKTYGDTDSVVNEKRNLDLYPTPHQTLPPLYSETDYKWADDKYDDSTRVDMGGFANKSYIRDELFDIDSDEDVIPSRDRKGVISPRDFYDA